MIYSNNFVLIYFEILAYFSNIDLCIFELFPL